MPHDRVLARRTTPKTRGIGTIVAAYCAGRDDARYGRGMAPLIHNPACRPGRRAPEFVALAFHRLGFNDEIRRMAEEKRLAQLDLPFEAAPLERSERRRAPRRRARERDSPGTLTELDIPPAR